MLKWCSYCQKFMGEVPNYENFASTHGLCAECVPDAYAFAVSEDTRPHALGSIQKRLFEAGERCDLNEAERIVDEIAETDIRAVDVLIGAIAPLLYKIGKEWELGVRSIADEKRFTEFCERTYELVAASVSDQVPAGATHTKNAEILLINAPGNMHTLGVRILALWLQDSGISAYALEAPLDLDEMTALVSAIQPRLLLVSIALAEQQAGVEAIVARISAIPAPIRPKIIVGGSAVKSGMVCAIEGASIVADINQLESFVRGNSLPVERNATAGKPAREVVRGRAARHNSPSASISDD